MHSVARPLRARRRRISYARVVVMRAPVAPMLVLRDRRLTLRSAHRHGDDLFGEDPRPACPLAALLRLGRVGVLFGARDAIALRQGLGGLAHELLAQGAEEPVAIHGIG